jgi:hypothetical protein
MYVRFPNLDWIKSPNKDGCNIFLSFIKNMITDGVAANKEPLLAFNTS